ncbi:MAG TPA: hypothetical protein DSN98_08375 [Thermoplasmata archaeon]|jgi:hypothetical protein|nr:MAG TPA: hypothetical protein DSN98_08375 [Thermoplasmata archaeon]
MTFKEFLKPDWRRLVVFACTMGGLNYLWISSNHILDARELFGLPFGFYPKGSFMIWPNHPTPSPVDFSWGYFLVDILFWYLLSCMVFYLLDYLKRHRKHELYR